MLKMAVQEASVHSNTESAYTEIHTDKDVITVKMFGANDVTLGEKPGMLERMRTTLFGASPEKASAAEMDNQRPSEQVTTQLENMSNVSSHSIAASPDPQQKKSVLDELDAYWQ